ncbi:COP1-interacting protein 4 [Quillaja saponaria]|uniref:COP1-interacting protein 4 n=1 Tax=Quillaja saponaria TaxID=32244 RepID=A0AAD7LGA2_QUISA|nr:COP1-interacting protein 4 [Quillaja saponaria]
MAKSSASEPDGGAVCNTVFIDTNLETHLALIVSDVDTVSDLKKRIQYEHPLCFPNIGKIQIHALKVKRRGYFYHLSDSMFVRSAFDGFRKSWFLTVDASLLVECNKGTQTLPPDCGNQVALLGFGNDNSAVSFDHPPTCHPQRISKFDNLSLLQVENCHYVKEVPAANQCGSKYNREEIISDLEKVVKPSTGNHSKVSSPGSDHETQDHCGMDYAPSSHTNFKEEESRRGSADMQCKLSMKGMSEASPSAKRKCKSKKKIEDTVDGCSSKENDASVLVSGKDTLQQDIVIPENPLGDVHREISYNISMEKNNVSSEPCQELSLNTSNKSSFGLEKSNNACKETEAPKEPIDNEVRCNKSLKEASESGLLVQKKSGIEKYNNENSLKENESAIYDCNGEILKPENARKCGVQKASKGPEVPNEHVEFTSDKSSDIDIQCNNSLEEDPESRPAVKRKRNSEEVKRSTRSDSGKEILKPENTTQHSFGDKQKITNGNLDDLLTKHFEDRHSVRTSASSGRKRKKGNKISDPLNQVVGEVPSSRKDIEEDGFQIPGKSVQAATTESCELSHGDLTMVHNDKVLPIQDASMSNTSGDNVEIKSNVLKKTSKPDKASQHSLGDKQKITHGNLESLSDEHFEDTHSAKTSASTGKRKKRKKTKDPPKVVAEVPCSDESMCKPTNQDNTDLINKVVDVAPKQLDANGISEPGKPEKKGRKNRKTKDLGAGQPLTKGMEYIDAFENETVLAESTKEVNCDKDNKNNEDEDNLFSQIKGKSLVETETTGVLISNNVREGTDANENGVGALEQISKTPDNAENVDKKKRKKSKKKESSTTKNLADMRTKDQGVEHGDLQQYSDSKMDREHSIKVKKKTKSESTNSTNKITRSDLVPQKDSGTNAVHAQLDSGIADSSQAPWNAPIANYMGRPLEANVGTDPSNNMCADEADSHLEVTLKNSNFNVNQHFVAGQYQHEAIDSGDVPVDKVNSVGKVDTKRKSERNENRVNSTEEKSHAANFITTQHQGLSSKDEVGVPRLQSDRMFSNVCRTGLEAQSSNKSDSLHSIVEGDRKPVLIKTSGKNTHSDKRIEALPVSNSKLEGSKKAVRQNKMGKEHQSGVVNYPMGVRKATGNIGEVVNNAQLKKNLLTTSAAIFKDDSSGSSEDDDSDASTRTPSDNSLSSDYSDGESNADLNSSQYGSYGGKKEENGRRSIIKTSSPGTKGMTIDRIFRSSSRYKKAKLTASQLEETESQPVEFVPDSLAN